MVKTFQISDGSGFLALVNVEKYDSFVDEDWDFSDLRERFIQEMNQNRLLFWSTGQEGIWNVRITTDKEENKPFRTIEGAIAVTNEKLFLINYEDLSMAAQFHDEKLPLRHNAGLVFPIENGTYKVRINQLFNPEKSVPAKNQHFEIVIEKALDQEVVNNFNAIPWLQ